jgi:hypothetical protein
MGTPAQRLPERVVLVVDDEDVVRRITTRALMEAGFRVLEAHDGEEAATLLATVGPKSGQGGPPMGYAGPFFAKPFTSDTLVAAVSGILPVAEAQRVSAEG